MSRAIQAIGDWLFFLRHLPTLVAIARDQAREERLNAPNDLSAVSGKVRRVVGAQGGS